MKIKAEREKESYPQAKIRKHDESYVSLGFTVTPVADKVKTMLSASKNADSGQHEAKYIEAPLKDITRQSRWKSCALQNVLIVAINPDFLIMRNVKKH